jgi:hypothetical protein
MENPWLPDDTLPEQKIIVPNQSRGPKLQPPPEIIQFPHFAPSNPFLP